MSAKGTLILALVFVVLCAGYFLMLYTEESGRQQRVEAQKVYTDLAVADISILEVHRVGEPVVTAHRTDEGIWAIDLPNPTIEPNQVTWERMAIAVTTLMNQRTIDTEVAEPEAYGLDDPVLTIVASTFGDKRIELEFGALEPTQSYRYGRADNGPVFLVNLKSFTEFDRPLSLLRNPYVLKIGEEGVRRLEFAHIWTKKPDEKSSPNDPEYGSESVMVAVEKGQDGKWMMVSPEQAIANQELVERFVQQVQFAPAQNHVDAPKNLDDYGLNPPRARITLFSGDDHNGQTLYLGSTASTDEQKPTVFAKQKERPAVFEMDAGVVMMVPKTPDAFREARMLSHQISDITSFEYKAPEANVVLENHPDSGWKLAGAEGETDQLAVSNFMATLKALQGRGFPGKPQPQHGLDSPSVLLTMHLKDGTSASIKVGAKLPNGEQYYATLDNGTVTLLNEIDVIALTKPESYFKNKNLLSFTPNEVVRIAMTFDGTNYVFEKPRGFWVVKQPSGKTLSSDSDIDALVKALSEVRLAAVERDTLPEDLTPYGLDNPLAVVQVMTSKGKETGIVTVGPLKIGSPATDDDQMRFAASDARPGVYRIRQAVVDEIRETLKGVQ